MNPPLHRLMNILWLHQQNHFNDEQLCDVIRDGLLDDVLKQWSDYMSSEGDQASDLEMNFMGKEQKGVGNYAARVARWKSHDREEGVFYLLLRYEQNPGKYKARTRRERLIDIIDTRNKKMKGRLPKDLLSEVESLERKFRAYKKKNPLLVNYWTDPLGNVVNRKGEIIIPRKEEAKAEK